MYVFVNYLNLILMLSGLFGTVSTNYSLTDSRISLLRSKRNENSDGINDNYCYFPRKIGTKVSFADQSCSTFNSCQGIDKKYGINDAIYKVVCDKGFILPNSKTSAIILCENGKWVDFEKQEKLKNLCEEVSQGKKKCEGQDENNCTTDGRRPIHTAAQKGQNDVIESLLKENVNIEELDKDGWTPLFYAVWKNQLETVKYLVSKGANPNKQETITDKRKPIHVAAQEGNDNIIEFLLTKGINIDEGDKDGWTPLFYAVWKGKLETVKYLISKGANINKEDTLSSKKKPIHVAAQNGHINVIDFFFTKNVNIEELDKDGWTPLFYAVWKNQLETVKYLVSKGANPNKQETITDKRKPIHVAVQEGNYNIIEFLLTKGINIDEGDKDGWTPLFYAVWKGKLETVKYLISKGANINKEDTLSSKKKPIHVAAENGHINVIDFFFTKNVNVDELEDNGWTPLFYAAWKGKLETVKYLISKGANPNKEEGLLPIHIAATKTNSNRRKPIHIAAREGHNDIIELLLAHDINVDEIENNGYTPLFYAVWTGKLETVKYLISKGANINKKETLVDKRKPIHIAAQAGNDNVIEFLLTKNVNVDELEKNGWTPLFYAVWKGKLETAKYLVSKGANVNKREIFKDGKKPMHMAAKYGHESIISFLLSKNVSINETDNRGWTPLRYATEENATDEITFLKSRGATIL